MSIQTSANRSESVAEKLPAVNERRKHSRVSPTEKVVFRINWDCKDPGSLSQPIFGTGIDLSADGAQISLNFPLPIDFPLGLWVDMPAHNDKFLVHGTVVWSGRVKGENGYRVGVELHDWPNTDKQRWNELFATC